MDYSKLHYISKCDKCKHTKYEHSYFIHSKWNRSTLGRLDRCGHTHWTDNDKLDICTCEGFEKDLFADMIKELDDNDNNK